MSKYPIYPDIHFSSKNSSTLIATSIRKEHRGKFYFWDVVTHHFGDDIESCVANFNRDCYAVLVLGTVNNKLIDQDGNPIFKQDLNTESEKDRLVAFLKN